MPPIVRRIDESAAISVAVQAAKRDLRKGHAAMLGLASVKTEQPRDRGFTAWLKLSRAALSQQLPSIAEPAACEALKARPSDPDAALALARALFDTEDLEAALVAAREAAGLAPGSFDAGWQVILTLLELGRTAEVLDTAGGDAALRGMALRRLGRTAEAAEILAAIGTPAARLAHAHCVHDLGRNDEAARLYGQLLDMAEVAEEAYWSLVNTLADGGRLAEAAAAYSRAAQTQPGFSKRWPEFVIPPQLLAEPVVLPQAEVGGLSMALGFVPFELPSVPLSPAVLKAYVEAHSPHRVGIADLNARFFQAVRNAVADKSTPFSLPDNGAFLAAADFLSTDSPDFLDPARYEPAALAFLEHATVLKAVFTRQCERIKANFGPIPWHARAMARALLAGNPRVVGLSAMFDEQLPALHAVARAVKALAPQVALVLGGGVFTRFGIEKVLALPYVDYVALHDGEEVLTALLDALAKGDAEPDIAGLCYRRADGGLAINDQTKAVKQETVPPADFTGFDLAAYFNPRPVLPLLTSRGCYWRRCTFCNHFASYAGNYKAQSIARVVDEIEQHMSRYGVHHFTLVDEMLSAARFRKIGEEILARELDITYYALAKPTADFDAETLDVMARSGCRYILWGQESGNERMLEMMDKGNTVASSRDTLNAAAAAGLRNHLFLMVGYPTEGLEEVEDTVRFLHANRAAVDQTQAGAFMLEKGTPLFTRPQDYGIARIFDRRGEGGCQMVEFEVAKGLQPHQAVAAERVLRRSFYGRFNPFSKLLGDFRDHALLVYSDLPRPTERVPMPSPEQVMAEVRVAVKAAG
jgi:radical SAM superfamily enzyme YgiQ (UPF0313 family)